MGKLICKKPMCAKCVEKKDKLLPSEITLRPITWMESFFLANSVRKHSEQDTHRDST